MRTRNLFLVFLTLFLTENTRIQAKSFLSDKEILVVYYSHSGNTKELAIQIKNAVGTDIFEIISLKPYLTDYQAVVDHEKRN